MDLDQLGNETVRIWLAIARREKWMKFKMQIKINRQWLDND